MSPKLRWSIPPNAVKGAMDALPRSFVRFLVDKVQVSSWVVNIANVASGWIVGKNFHIYKDTRGRKCLRLPILSTGRKPTTVALGS